MLAKWQLLLFVVDIFPHTFMGICKLHRGTGYSHLSSVKTLLLLLCLQTCYIAWNVVCGVCVCTTHWSRQAQKLHNSIRSSYFIYSIYLYLLIHIIIFSHISKYVLWSYGVLNVFQLTWISVCRAGNLRPARNAIIARTQVDLNKHLCAPTRSSAKTSRWSHPCRG